MFDWLFEKKETESEKVSNYVKAKMLQNRVRYLENRNEQLETLDGFQKTLSDSFEFLWKKECELVKDLEAYMRENGLETPWVDQNTTFYLWKKEQENKE